MSDFLITLLNNFYSKFIDPTIRFASHLGPLWAKGLSSEKSVKRNFLFAMLLASSSDILPLEKFISA